MIKKRSVDPVMLSLWIALAVAVIFWMTPFVFMVFTALKSKADLMQNMAFMPPTELHWENFARAWKIGKFNSYMINSLIITFTKVPIGLFVAAMAAFAFSRLKFRFQKILFLIVVMGSMIPIQVCLGPIFQVTLKMKLLSTYIGLLLPYIAFGLPYHIFLFNGFFKSLSVEMDEAALIDGCSKFGLFWRIILPLSLPILGATFILDFVATWNEFAIALVLLQDNATWTLPLGLMGFKGFFSTDYGPLNSAILIGILPVVIVYLMFQRFFVTGLTAGAVKG